jgi:P-type Ca2+ transporter type 2C
MKITYPLKDAHSISANDILQSFQTNAEGGLSTAESEKRTATFGANVYQAQKQKSIWLMIVHQFASPIVYLLIAGAVVSVYFKDYAEAIAILIVILVNALIGFLMELQARNSMKALREMDIIKSKVIRDGKTQEIASEKLTPGDIIILEAGDVVPGDGRLITANQLQCDESSLTGESIPSEKNTEPLQKDTPLGDRLNMVFKGTSVMNGNAKVVITGIAQHTELGTITSLVEGTTDATTPLDKKLSALSKILIWLTLILTLLFALTGFLQGKAWVLIIKTSIALAVAAFPEGLPIVSTVALAYGMMLMAKRNAIVKKLSAVETLGSTTVILTDKTGTLTENKIYVNTFSFPEETVKVSIDKNELKFENGEIVKSVASFDKLKLVGALCNDATLQKGEDKKKAEKKALGDPIEIALLALANTSGTTAEALRKQYERVGEKPFNSADKIMGTLHRTPNGKLVAAKGAVENILQKCTKIQIGTSINDLNDENRKTILATSEKMAAEGLRVLAFAYKEELEISHDEFLNNLAYLGMVGFLDPPRLDIKEAVAMCKNAGIKIIMITGDHPLTALNIAKQTGLVEESETEFIVGRDLPPKESLTQIWRKKIVENSIFARTSPKQKLEIAAVFQKDGNIVAMTGDGINDAPALKQADVGIAMGLRGTQVAKEVASIVLKDDSFTSIAEAISQGRAIFRNIKKFVVYLVSCNLSEIFIVTALGFFAPASILLPLQILFLNMVTDVFPALALGLGKGDKTVMEVPPNDPKTPIVSGKNWFAVVIYALIITLAVILAIQYCKQTISTDAKVVNNVAFITLAFAQLFHVFNMASMRSKFWINEVTKNKFVWLAILICAGLMGLVYVITQTQTTLGLVELPLNVWAVSIVASLLPLMLVQGYKVIYKLKKTGKNVKREVSDS